MTINKLENLWNRGYESTPIRAGQSIGIFVVLAGLLAAGLAIGAGISGMNALDFTKTLLENHTFQLGSMALGAVMAGYLFRRITHPRKKEANPDTEMGNRILISAYVMLVAAALFGCGLGVAAFAYNVDYTTFSMHLLNNKLFALSTVAGSGLLLGVFLNYALHGTSKTHDVEITSYADI